jgi:hypothetical protein
MLTVPGSIYRSGLQEKSSVTQTGERTDDEENWRGNRK